MTNGNSGDQERLAAVAQALAQEPQATTDAMQRIAQIATTIREAAQAVAKQQTQSAAKLNELADDIESEARHRLGNIISDGRAFWNTLERRLTGTP